MREPARAKAPSKPALTEEEILDLWAERTITPANYVRAWRERGIIDERAAAQEARFLAEEGVL